MSHAAASGPIQHIEPRTQTEARLWAAALVLAAAAHLAALAWAAERIPGPAPEKPPVETRVSVEMIEMATQAAQPTVAETKTVKAAEAPAPPEPTAPVMAPERSSSVAESAINAPVERLKATPSPRPASPPLPASVPARDGVTRVTAAAVAAQSGAARAERAETTQTARAEELRQAREAAPARIAAAPVVSDAISRPKVASAERPPEQVPRTARARVVEDRIVAGQDAGRERLRSETEMEAQNAVREAGPARPAASPDPAPARAPSVPAEASPADTVAALAPAPARLPTTPAAAPTSERVTARPAIPEGMTLERFAPTPAAPPAEVPSKEALSKEAAAPAPERESGLPGPATEGGAAAPAAASDISANDRNRYSAILDYLKFYDGGPCFAALPALGEGTAQLTLDAFGPSSASLGDFRAGMEAETGAIPNTFLNPVSEAQCATLAFIRGARAYPAFNLHFDIKNRAIASGDDLEGRILNVSGQVVHVLLIDDEGRVQALDSFLQFNRTDASFSIPMNLTAGPVVTQQLLLAVGTPARLSVVSGQNGSRAENFFKAMAAELEARGISPDLSMVAFSVE